MGIAGHVGFAFAPVDEGEAIAALIGGDLAGEPRWLKRPTNFGITGDDWQEVNLVLRKLAGNDASLEPLASVIIGKRSIGEGPGTDYFLHRADDLRAMAEAFGRVTEEALDVALDQALVDPELQGWQYPQAVREPLKGLFRGLGREVDELASNGWAMIGLLC